VQAKRRLVGVLVLLTTATATTRSSADGYYSGTTGARAAVRGGAFTA
jgi:hypothetical protein